MVFFSFGKGKKLERKVSDCSCNGVETKEENDVRENSDSKICTIKVLGTGCKSCHEQYENAKRAVKEMGYFIEVKYITDIKTVMKYGVMSMPALVVNEKVVSVGKVLKSAEVVTLLHRLGF